MSTAPSPSRWHVDPVWSLIIDSRGNEIAAIHTGNKAHQALLAAAPELLAVCEKALEALRNVPQVGEAYDQQHSDTHQRAALELAGAIATAIGKGK